MAAVSPVEPGSTNDARLGREDEVVWTPSPSFWARYHENILASHLRELGYTISVKNVYNVFEDFHLGDYMEDPSFTAQLEQKKKEVCAVLKRTLQNFPELRGSEELKKLFGPICWSSESVLHFLCRLSDRLKASDQADHVRSLLLNELNREKRRVFARRWIEQIETKDWPNHSKYSWTSVEELLRFMRNEWIHLQEYFHGLGSGKRFLDYFNERFPDLLIVAYRAALHHCSEEEWFKEFC